MKIAFLASGNLGLTTIEAIADHLMPSLIATDSKSDGIINFAVRNNISLFKGNPREGRLSQYVASSRFDLIISVNYLFILEPDVIYLSEYVINLHGSLLPKYRGRTPHVWAIINNEKETGVTAHFIDEKCDSGDIILQKIIEIDIHDTGASILKKYEVVYPKMIFEIINRINAGSLQRIKQDETKATFFGKRTPADGLINWNWHKERIYNWVRAQSFPYPGAYTYYNHKKVIIDEIAYNDLGYSQNLPNGLILNEHPYIVVKTPNGAIELRVIRNNKINFIAGEVLN